ncbi:MAG TPA: bifunctional nicotinamidase/pyrazinamidase [Chthoniobacteraceae bacterium]|jgi:nicotinamidase/pyrazinamidase|nr:bifunctional nicotinamidase/pyrazinamidase [Chthoniobacteraceae bacterium]
MNALLLIDVQNDFVPGGALAVREGDAIVPLLNELQPRFDLVVTTQDWHPATHGSFAAQHPGRQAGERIDLHGLPQILWPVHCVEESHGADFVAALDRARWSRVFRKGTNPELDSYSGFFDNGHRHATGLGDYLRERGVTAVYLAGLATDYCVKFTALDARQLGFETYLIEDACRGVNLRPGDVEAAVREMKAAGVRVAKSEEILARPPASA